MKFDIKHTAKLANIPLEKGEETKLELQLEQTLEHVERLKDIPTASVVPTYQVTGLENITREDSVLSSLPQKQVLENASSVYNGFFKVEAILEQ